MNIVPFILSVLFFAAGAAAGAGAEDAPQAPAAAAPLEDEFPDLSGLRDPFLSQLPIEEIIKTAVEPAVQKVDNTQSGPLMPLPKPSENMDVKPAVSMPMMQLQGVIWGGDMPQAIINDKVVSVGDHIENVEITGIQKDGVEILFQGEKFHVQMEE